MLLSLVKKSILPENNNVSQMRDIKLKISLPDPRLLVLSRCHIKTSALLTQKYPQFHQIGSTVLGTRCKERTVKRVALTFWLY